MAKNTRETISFRKVIAAGANGINFAEEIKGDATIEKLVVRFYPGQQKSLQVTPMVKFRTEEMYSLVRYATGTDGYLTGDDDTLEYPLGVEVQTGDQVVIYATNTDSTNAYSLVCDVIVDYLNGKARVS